MKEKFLSVLTGLSMGIAMGSVALASGTGGGSVLDNVLGDDFGKNDNDANAIVGQIGSPIFAAIQAIGVIVAVIMVAYVGIKYLTAGAGQKAEVNSTLVPMLAGAALVALAPTLVKWAFGAFGGI